VPPVEIEMQKLGGGWLRCSQALSEAQSSRCHACRKTVPLQLAERLEDVALVERLQAPSGTVLNPNDNSLAQLSQQDPRWSQYLIRIEVLLLLLLFVGAVLHKELSRAVHSCLANMEDPLAGMNAWPKAFL
jgi:hypothetical protein